MKECCGSHFILNGQLESTGSFNDSLVFKGDSIYEVIRMTKGIPVFFNDHIERLKASLKIQNKKLLADINALRTDILQLTHAEKKKEINIKVVFNYNENESNYLIYYIDSAYPTSEQYNRGVKTILYFAERKDPNAKVLNYRLRSAIHQELANEQAYEAFLVNNDNLITEGSRSNVFFIKNGLLFTAPEDIVLKGITRKYIIQVCNEIGIEVRFECISADDISSCQSSFITGTSPMVLPVCCIDENHFDVSNTIMAELRRYYLKKVEKSLESFIQ
ncbi:MAG TPA: aminotransferase class IV [Bacteroidales bacterium]|nr:aminotransferase class IV [Bacteroidales bacterium]